MTDDEFRHREAVLTGTDPGPTPSLDNNSENTNHPQKRGRGRPPTYGDDIKKEIIDRLMNGETLKEITNDEHMPDESTWYLWRQNDPKIKEVDDLLKPIRARALFERSLRIVDEADEKDAVYIASTKAKVYMHAASLLDPSQFSDKTHPQLGKAGALSANGVNIQINIGQSDGSVETVTISTEDE